MLAAALEKGTVSIRGLSLVVRDLQPDDWPAVAEIYWDGMRDGLATFETEVPSWEVWDRVHLARHRLGAEVRGEAAGWAALSRAPTRRRHLRVVGERHDVGREARGAGVRRRLVEGP